MTDEYTRAVLARADRLQTGEAALRLLDEHSGHGMLRAWLAAALAGLMALYPAISAAQLLP